MANILHLFELVKSLSKSEKRYFKMSARLQQGDKVFMNLFDIIDNEKKGRDNIKHKLKKSFPKAAFEPACAHLYKAIMRSLKSFTAEKSSENKLLNIISDVRILFDKGMLKLCFAELERGKKLALKHEKYFLFLQMARTELQYITTLEFSHINESGLITRQEKITDILYSELFINKHSSLFEILYHRYHHQGVMRSDLEIEKLNDLVLEEFQVNANERYHSCQSDKLHLHFQSLYFMMTGNPEQSLKEFYQLDKLFEANASRWEDEPVYYIYLLHGITISLRWMKKYEDMQYFINRLKKIKAVAPSLEVLAQHIIYQHELEIALDLGKFNEGLLLIHEYEKQIMNVHQAPSNVFATTQLQISLIYFGLNDFRKSLHYINSALKMGEAFISHQVYGLCRLLSLIIHIELNNDDHLIYAIRSTERKFKTEKKLYQVEKLTIDFARKWTHVKATNKKEILINYHDELLKLKENRYENQFLKSFNFVAWAESKIKGV